MSDVTGAMAIARTIAAKNEEITRLRAALEAANHHPDCNYWKWDWRYSWDVTDCICDKVGALKGQSDG